MVDGAPVRALLVVNYGSHQLIDANLGPFLEDSTGWLVVVVDSFSTPAERAAVQRLCVRPGWHACLLEGNPGFGAGMNAGAERAFELGATQLLMINPDAELSRATAELLMAGLSDDRPAMAAPVITRSNGKITFSGGSVDQRTGVLSMHAGAELDADSGEVVGWLTGACLAVGRDLWRELGGFEPDYFMYWEDVDLTVRAVRAGARLQLVEAARVVHDAGGTQGEQSAVRPVKSPLYVRYNCRNRLVFAVRCVERRFRRRWVVGAPRYAYDVLLRSGRRELLRRPSLVLAAIVGTVEGLAYLVRHGR